MISLTVDAHIDLPWIMTKYGEFQLEHGFPGVSGMSLPLMRRGGLGSFFAALYLSDKMQDDLGSDMCDKLIDEQIAALKRQEYCRVVRTGLQARAAAWEGLTPIFMGLEGGRLLNDGLMRLEELHKAGIRYLTLTHNRSSSWCDSATELPIHGGLSAFGLDVIRKCEELDILVDVSHCSDDVIEDVLEHGCRPFIASHSGARRVTPHLRNIPDDLIRAMAARGCVIHVPFARKFVGPRMEGVANHIDHIVQLVGDHYHVGIGSDLDGAQMVDHVVDASQWDDVVLGGLDKKGYKANMIDAIAGANTLRLLQ